MILAGCLSILSLLFSAFGQYNKNYARVGVWCLIATVFAVVVGVAYPLILVGSVLGLYVLFYWIIWRVLIKNIIVAFSPDKPKK